MDYISEAERLKLYYKGLNEAGSGEQIATAHPDLVSGHAESDDNAESLEADSFYLHSMLPYITSWPMFTTIVSSTKTFRSTILPRSGY